MDASRLAIGIERRGAGGVANPLALVGIQETDDPCLWERCSQPWEVLAMPLGPGPFHNRKVFLATPNCILYHESFASRLRVRALSPEGMLACSVPIRSGSRTSYFNLPLHERGLPAMLPGAAEAVLDVGQRHYMVLIRLALLRRLLSGEQLARLEAAAGSHCLAVSPEVVQRLGRWLNAILTRTHQAPEMLRHTAAVQTLERELVVRLAGALTLSVGRELPQRSSLRQRGFDRAIEHIRYADLTALDPTTLCAVAGASQRTLEYAFQERLGLSPAAFIRQLRLHALRRELLASRLGESSVTELAYHLGFTQLGRLAGDYRRVFGERPSATLARPFQGDAPPFWLGRPAPESSEARVA
jgi:AraC family transcriptional regulator, ethanolamine operon transcriptional activator